MSNPLRYRISNWTQLPLCKSNYSAALHVRVANFVNDSRLQGQRITIFHDEFGEVFSAMIAASGSIVNSSIPCCVTDQGILRELERFGFMVEYRPIAHLKSDILRLLISLDGLGYDKIRVLKLKNVPLSDKTDSVIVAFKTAEHPEWLNVSYEETYRVYAESAANGSAYTFYRVPKDDVDWTWLDFVANIPDILRENAYNGDNFNQSSSG